MEDISPRHKQARELAAAGIPVFPCLIDGKAPVGWLVPNGLKDRTTDLNLIDKWWASGDWNVGVVPEDMGCYVVDLDTKYEHKNGLETWGRLCEENAWTPEYELTVKTPSGGFHIWKRGSMAPSVGTVRKGLGPGIDIRGRESYVLIPPSIINGVEYTIA